MINRDFLSFSGKRPDKTENEYNKEYLFIMQ